MNALQTASPVWQNRRDRLVASCVPMVHGLVVSVLHVGKWHRDYDDAVSAGMEGLVRAANKFNHVRGVQFSTYAFTCIRRDLISFSRKWLRNGVTGLNDEYLKDHGRVDQEFAYLDELPNRSNDDPDEEDVQHLRHKIGEAMKCLDARTRNILDLRYCRGRSLRQVANAYRLTRERIRQIERVGMNKIREKLADLVEERR